MALNGQLGIQDRGLQDHRLVASINFLALQLVIMLMLIFIQVANIR